MKAPRLVAAAFDKGQIPQIACINRATVDLGVDFSALIAAMQQYVDKYVAPVWGTPAKLIESADFIKGGWAMVFLDDADEAGALAYHDLTPGGLPLSKVFVKTTLDAKELVSVSATHELVEMLVDPAINMAVTEGPDKKAVYAYETADPVEETWFAIDGIQMSNFVYPSYFESFRKRGSTQFDAMGKVKKPFQLLQGGYQSIWKNGRWSNIFGSKPKQKRFKREDRRGHRSESRGTELQRARALK